ncbi:MAG TPA: endopeptidase, partial [Stenotrophomonas sp.]|nr:endopeptidase [Stenotrophomonas sp.]
PISAPPAAAATPHVDAPVPTTTPPSSASDAPTGLLLPVQGIQASQLRDTFTDAR